MYKMGQKGKKRDITDFFVAWSPEAKTETARLRTLIGWRVRLTRPEPISGRGAVLPRKAARRKGDGRDARECGRKLERDAQFIRLDASPITKPGYEDEDGEAPESSLRAYSDTWQKVAIAIFSVTGWELSLALAILSLQAKDKSFLIVPFWLQMGGWMMQCIQSTAFFIERSTVERYTLGLHAFWASSLTLVISGLNIFIPWCYGNDVNIGRASTGLLISQAAVAVIRGLCCVLIPRRPNVYYDGQMVDQEFTVSAFNRFTYTYVSSLLHYTGQNKNLDVDSLPKLPFAARAQILHARLEQTRGTLKLWKTLVMGNVRPLVLQTILSVVTCVLGFGPQVALYGILTSLEGRSTESGPVTAAWLWVLTLGFMLVLSLGIESWLWWLIYSQLWIPIYEGLSALVFAKSMRCKDAKHLKPSKKEGDEDEEDEQEKSRQSIINLAAVDSKRIADFATFNYLIPSCLMRLGIAAAFLVHLIGWRSLLAGVGVAVLVMPVNAYLTKGYTSVQQELMKASDKRTSAVTEVLQGIRQIKFAALEQEWQDHITQKREAELKLLWKTSLYTTGMVSVWILGPLMLSAVSLTVYALIHGELSASVAFTALSVFGNLESALASLPDLLSRAMEAKVSTDRIDKYLTSADKAPHTTDVEEISFENATLAWPADESSEDQKDWERDDRFVLRHLTLQFPRKGLSVIAGKTGSGKSLVLASLLGECDVLAGSVAVPHSPPLDERFDHRATRDNWILDSAIAYVAQNPWMENATIKDNILFGLPYNWSRYRKVLFASGLEKDLTMLPDGEMTEIGANGINLSGGQRWRVSFARALYSRAGILVMDDIFSALDAETGRHVYEHALTGELGRDRTRILVTHHVGLCLPRTDYCVLLENGSMTHAGSVEELSKMQGLTDVLHNLATERAAKRQQVDEEDAVSRRKRSSVGPPPAAGDENHRKFTQDEKRETGAISWSVYMAYVSKGNRLPVWALTFLAYAVFTALLVGRSWWVSLWTSSSHTSSHPVHTVSLWHHTLSTTKSSIDPDLVFYLSVYVGISVAACAVGTLRTLSLAFASLHSSRQMFEDLLAVVLRAPLRWLDTVPLGRILNRFTGDVYMLDWRLAYDLGNLVFKILELVGIIVAGVMVSPVIMVFAGLLLIVCVQMSWTYLGGVREVKRLESTAKSPVMEQFGSSLVGLTTIRAFNKADVYVRQMYERIDRHAQAAWNLWLFNRWLGFRMSIVGAIFSTATAAFVVYVPSISAALAGFAMSFALQYNYAVAMGLRFYANVEMDMNATERVLEYSAMETEDQGGVDPPAAWPTRGHVEFEDLQVGYAPELPPVLDGLSFTIEHNQRVGVVGRTGAGKSSLTLALFRFLEARQGRITIDGQDISKIKLQALRSRLAIIPQDPVLFSGTVRSNLDPFHEHTDLELYNALERVHLLSFEDTLTLGSQPSSHDPLSGSDTLASSSASSTATNTPPKPANAFASLWAPVSEGGYNLSQGQRQLLCLARAIVSQPKIMILDEATSAVDMETDALIQRSIRAEFGRNSSLLVIAHRLSTIADFDKILVMDAGRAVEFGTPKELMHIKAGVFRNLVENSGERAVLEEIILGKGK
ncbi:P-loop containing nucleoside triphosphate hydrolase protein [Aspergillus steynii IBT 23096]|uniref:P-loop containing nucleoside triphosphate hydrolase protein n=1 Tax=Aspergillus steynii IBT 23096 TaxID=1392250 RepID=A0A2I2G6Y5_9EURO|nr:P-loop containing nucleoside triphosphate hydrolase protein [Aspergillus steynii IBT 23096]PLB48636.1 P-loop containing nucleoside triphosphate hydrolase protein [Aspergillus steynii IBT 23096]